VIIFGSVRFLSKKSNQTEFFLKKPKPSQNWFKPAGFGSVQIFREKPVQTGFARFDSVFFRVFYWVQFGSVFSVLGL